MPELPEVEIVRQSLLKNIKGKKINKVLVRNRNLRFKLETSFEKKLKNKFISNIKRFSKYLIIELKNKGFFYAEDFYLKKNISYNEKADIAKFFHANHLVNLNIYEKELVNNNFEILDIKDMSKNWTTFTKKRLEDYIINYENHLKII